MFPIDCDVQVACMCENPMRLEPSLAQHLKALTGGSTIDGRKLVVGIGPDGDLCVVVERRPEDRPPEWKPPIKPSPERPE